MKKNLLLPVNILIVLMLTQAHGFGQQVDGDKERLKGIATEITELRSKRAMAFIKSGSKITPDLFKGLCGAVKKRAMALAKKEGLLIRHSAVKNRNPGHAATKEEIYIHRRFESDPAVKEIWDETTKDGKKYKRFILPVYVEKACLACHGPKEKRPGFIRKKYPDDKAFGFKEGDLRGIIEVMAPVR